jgi:hypothetical protein
MWKAMFLAIGIFMMLLGVQCLGVSKFTLNLHDSPPAPTSLWDSPTEGAQRTVTPRPWTPWTLISTGAVVCLYCFTIPRRIAGN